MRVNYSIWGWVGASSNDPAQGLLTLPSGPDYSRNSRDAEQEVHLVLVADAGQIGVHALARRVGDLEAGRGRRHVETAVGLLVVQPAVRASDYQQHNQPINSSATSVRMILVK